MDRVIHPIPPLYNGQSRVLVLGSFPSVKSREAGFFYHHPQNRFWKVISALYEEPLPATIEGKRDLLLRNRIAVWDVIQSCEITGSADSSIKNVVPNDLALVLEHSGVEQIFANGSTSYQLYMKYIYPDTGIEIRKLPSTSPANATYSLSRLLEEWSILKAYT